MEWVNWLREKSNFPEKIPESYSEKDHFSGNEIARITLSTGNLLVSLICFDPVESIQQSADCLVNTVFHGYFVILLPGQKELSKCQPLDKIE